MSNKNFDVIEFAEIEDVIVEYKKQNKYLLNAISKKRSDDLYLRQTFRYGKETFLVTINKGIVTIRIVVNFKGFEYIWSKGSMRPFKSDDNKKLSPTTQLIVSKFIKKRDVFKTVKLKNLVRKGFYVR